VKAVEQPQVPITDQEKSGKPADDQQPDATSSPKKQKTTEKQRKKATEKQDHNIEEAPPLSS